MSWAAGTPPTPPTTSDFRATFPAFGDRQGYPDAMIQIWLNLAGGTATQAASLDASRWQQFWPLGVMLFAAHFIVLNKRDEQVAEAGGVPGNATSGPTASKSVGAASISFDVNSTTEQNAGFWNLTTYGRQFYRLSRMAGMGGVQVNGPYGGFGPDYLNGPAWPGVIYPWRG